MISLLRKTFRKLSPLLNSESLKARTARGGAWLLSGSAVENAARFVRNMIVVRLIAPELLGVYAIIVSVNYLFEAFTYMGVKEAVIQNREGSEHALLNTALLISAIRSVGIAAIGCLIVPLFGLFYHKPEITPLLQFSMLGIVCAGLTSPAAYSEIRKMQYRRWAIANHGAAVLSVLLSIVLYYYVRTIWALMIGFVGESFIKTFFSYALFPFKPSARITRKHFDTLMLFIRGMIGMPILLFLYDRVDIFVLGKTVGDAELGIYNMAKTLIIMPVLVFSLVANQILLPLFSSQQDDPAALVERYGKIQKWMALTAFPLFTLVACFAKYLLLIIYGPKYVAAESVVRWFCATNSLKLIGIVSASVFFAMGKPDLLRNSSLVRLAVIAVIIYPMSRFLGINGAAIAVFVSLVVWQIMVFFQLRGKMATATIRSQAMTLVHGAGISAAIAIGYFAFLTGRWWFTRS